MTYTAEQAWHRAELLMNDCGNRDAEQMLREHAALLEAMRLMDRAADQSAEDSQGAHACRWLRQRAAEILEAKR